MIQFTSLILSGIRRRLFQIVRRVGGPLLSATTRGIAFAARFELTALEDREANGWIGCSWGAGGVWQIKAAAGSQFAAAVGRCYVKRF